MKGVFLFALFLRALAKTVAAPNLLANHGFDSDNGASDMAAAQITSDILSHELPTRTVIQNSSPQCWMASISKINRWTIDDGTDSQKQLHSSGSSYCASMTEDQREILALEITNCRIMKEKRPFFQVSTTNRETDPMELMDCLVGRGGMSPYEATSCLPLMTDSALSLFRMISLHLNEGMYY